MFHFCRFPSHNTRMAAWCICVFDWTKSQAVLVRRFPTTDKPFRSPNKRQLVWVWDLRGTQWWGLIHGSDYPGSMLYMAIHGYKTYVFLAKSLEAPEASDSFGLSKVATWKMEKLDENWSVDSGRIVDSVSSKVSWECSDTLRRHSAIFSAANFGFSTCSKIRQKLVAENSRWRKFAKTPRFGGRCSQVNKQNASWTCYPFDPFASWTLLKLDLQPRGTAQASRTCRRPG